VKSDEIVRLASVFQNGLAEAESSIPNLHKHLAALVATGCTDIQFYGRAVLNRTAALSCAATDARIVCSAAVVMLRGIVASRRGASQ
jgi:hypothetical protein